MLIRADYAHSALNKQFGVLCGKRLLSRYSIQFTKTTGHSTCGLMPYTALRPLCITIRTVMSTKRTISTPAVLLIHHRIRRLILCLNKLTNPDRENHHISAPVKMPKMTLNDWYGCSRCMATPELVKMAKNTNTASGLEKVTKKVEMISLK